MADNGFWNNVTMTSTEANVYSAEIEAYPRGTDVCWKIIAKNNIGKTSRINSASYSVVTEFPSWMILPLLLVASIAVIICKKKLTRQCAYAPKFIVRVF
jgi:hypothetical protein